MDGAAIFIWAVVILVAVTLLFPYGYIVYNIYYLIRYCNTRRDFVAKRNEIAASSMIVLLPYFYILAMYLSKMKIEVLHFYVAIGIGYFSNYIALLVGRWLYNSKMIE